MRRTSKLFGVLLPLIFFITILPMLIAQIKLNAVVVEVKAAQVELNLTILPVRFVYLDENQQIIKIYNNARVDDQQYLLKFFDASNQEIIVSDQKIMERYLIILENINPFQEGFIFDSELNDDSKNLSRTNFTLELKKNNFGLEEIYTYI